MDFFRSVFSDDRQPHISSSSLEAAAAADDASPALGGGGGGGGGGWSFGGLIKNIACKSEVVILTYRRDLEEFGTGLRKETAAIREAAARAVLDLPGSLEAGASAAQESLESVGQAIDDIGGSVWRGTAEIIAHGKDAIVSMDVAEANSKDRYSSSSSDRSAAPINPIGSSSKRYNRFEAQVLAIQSDANTFSEEPEDAEDFERWKSEFDLAGKEEEIETLCYEIEAVEGFLEKLVPGVVDYETFWCRYYYRVHKLKQAEDARAKLVKRVIARDEEENLSWDVDDEEDEVKEEEEEEIKEEKSGDVAETKVEEEENKKEKVKSPSKEFVEAAVEEKEAAEVPQVVKLDPPAAKSDDEVKCRSAKASNSQSVDKEVTSKPEDNIAPEEKGEVASSSKDSDFSIVSGQPSVQDEEDELDWDEIEDLGEHEDKKIGVSSGSPLRVDLQKRLSAAEEDEDLSWDIEEDEESTNP